MPVYLIRLHIEENVLDRISFSDVEVVPVRYSRQHHVPGDDGGQADNATEEQQRQEE